MSTDEKIYQAYQSGPSNQDKCTLIITLETELTIYALEYFDREFCGIVSLKGIPQNVRNLPRSKICCGELQKIITAMGLDISEKYTDTVKLNYNSILILTKNNKQSVIFVGLLINFFHCYWPNLLKCPGFINSMKKDFNYNIVTYHWSG